MRHRWSASYDRFGTPDPAFPQFFRIPVSVRLTVSDFHQFFEILFHIEKYKMGSTSTVVFQKVLPVYSPLPSKSESRTAIASAVHGYRFSVRPTLSCCFLNRWLQNPGILHAVLHSDILSPSKQSAHHIPTSEFPSSHPLCSDIPDDIVWKFPLKKSMSGWNP